MRRLWAVEVTLAENWGLLAAIATRRYEVLAVDARDAEHIIREHLAKEYHDNDPTLEYRFHEFVICPLLCDMNAIRDGLCPKVRCLDE